MNDAEKVAYEWLLARYRRDDIDFDRGRYIDFICVGKDRFEVKKLQKTNLLFSANQHTRLKPADRIIVVSSDLRVIDVFRWVKRHTKKYNIIITKMFSLPDDWKHKDEFKALSSQEIRTIYEEHVARQKRGD